MRTAFLASSVSSVSLADLGHTRAGDWKYPVVDASREAARRRVRDEEDAILSGKLRGRPNKAHLRPSARHRPGSYGALAEREPLVRRDSPAMAGELEAAAKKDDKRPRHQASSRADQATSSDHPIPIGTSVVQGASHVLHAALPLGSPDKDTLAARKREHAEQARLPPDAVDLIVEDVQAEEEEQMRQRRRGEPGGKKMRVYRVAYVPPGDDGDVEARAYLDPDRAEEGQKVKSPLEDERARVMDVVERDEDADGPVPGSRSAADGGDGGSSPTSASSSDDGAKAEVVRIAVQDKETHVKQAGVDEDASSSRRSKSRSPFPRDHPVLTEDDNPWR